jgi:hypothetical protein
VTAQLQLNYYYYYYYYYYNIRVSSCGIGTNSFLIIFLLSLITYHLSMRCVIRPDKADFLSYPRAVKPSLHISHPTCHFKAQALHSKYTTSLLAGNVFLQLYTF